MKKHLFWMLLASFVLTSCNYEGRLLTSANGTIYECLLVCEDGVKEPVLDTMREYMYGMPQDECCFTMSHVPNYQFDSYLKGTRNILLIDINANKYTQVKVSKSQDVWAKPQAMVRIQAPDRETFLSYWEANGKYIREWFVQEEIARQISFYKNDFNKEAKAKLNKQGYDLYVPMDFLLVKDTTIVANGHRVKVLWTCNNKGPMRRDLMLYHYLYTDQNQFSNDSIAAMRSAVVGQLITGSVPGSYMGTDMKFVPPMSRYVQQPRDTAGGFYGMETRGLWRVENGEAMGGPFVCLTRLDQVNARVVTAEVFLYAAGQKKRNEIRKLEALLYTLKMPNER